MKFIFFMIVTFLSVGAQAQLLSFKEFSQMTPTQKELTLKAYKEFLAKYPMPLETKSDVVTKLDFISLFIEAHAAGDYNCFFAGWPSKSVSVGSRSVCSSPSKTNSDYQAQASKCGNGSMLCQPILFGDIGCISASTPKQKSLAFSSCESKFKSSGKTLAEVVAGLTNATKAAAAEEVFGLVASICSSGTQATKPMCNNLKNKVAAIKAIKPAVATPPAEAAGTATATPGGTADLAAAGTLAATTLSGGVEPTVICDPAASQPGSISATGDPILAVCGRPNPDTLNIPKTMDELKPLLDEYGIEIAAGQTPDVEDIRKFLAEVKRFPSALYADAKARGAKIRLIVGTGVTDDGTFKPTSSPTGSTGSLLDTDAKCQTVPKDPLCGLRSWSTIPGVGGAIYSQPPIPTRIVVNHLYDEHGSRSLVMHEHMHTIDFMFKKNTFSESQAWSALRSNEKMVKLMDAMDKGTTQPHYCKDHPEESLAEIFAYYNGCQQAKDQVKAFLPELATYLDSFSVDSACAAEPARCPGK